MEKYTLTAVSYLNTKPFMFGILSSRIAQQLDIQLDIPSKCAERLSSGQADIGLVPVGALHEIPNARIISDYCIGSTGAVRTVCIFAEKPLSQLTHIYLDYHSRTSVELAKVLLEQYWKVSLQPIPATPGFEQRIGGTVGGLIIGDRAFGLEARYPFVYDLAEAWTTFTGLPFVFAAWVSTVPVSDDFIADFNHALHTGINRIRDLMLLIPPPYAAFNLKEYYTQNISYRLDDAKREGMNRFLKSIQEATPVP